MPRPRFRYLAALLCWLMLSPAAALADGTSTSAGDQQYVDPLAGATTPSATPKSSGTPTTTSSATPAAPSAGGTTSAGPAPGVGPAPASGSGAAGAPAAGGGGSSASASASTAAADPRPGTLPFTGFDTGVAVAGGLVLLAAGAGLRRLARAG